MVQHKRERRPSRTARPEYVSIDEAAEYLGVVPLTVRRWISAGLLPASRLGPRMVRIRRDDLDALLTPIAAGEAG